MEDKDRVGEHTFRVNFSEDGASKLAARLTDTLKEYIGDFVDDTLVKYVIVLLGNGRRKEEVKEELNVFLGDKSNSFVTWLWDHLASNLDRYIHFLESCPDKVAKAKPHLVEHTGKIESHHSVSVSDRGKSSKSSKSRHNRDWRGLKTDDNQPFLSSAANNTQNEEKAHHSAVHARQSVSREHLVHGKRTRPNELARMKREASQATIAAPRKLLQFAVRDAVSTTRPTSSMSEPAQKRLCSVVSTSAGNSTEEVHPPKIKSVARLSNPLATAIKAVAEAAEDVRRVRTGNVFDRLSCSVDGGSGQVSTFRETVAQDDDYEDHDQVHDKTRQTYLQTRDYSGQFNVNASMMDCSTCLASDSASDNEGHDNVNVGSCRGMDVFETGTSNKADDSLMVKEYSVAQNTEEMMHQSQEKDLEPLSAADMRHKIVNISVNVNTWKPHHYQSEREMVEVETQRLTLETDNGTSNSNVGVMTSVDAQKESQKTMMPSALGPYSAGRPLEDADSRTIFVYNVHFAATKDTLSWHFNKFGEVLKVIILTDAARGHPNGSAYVEFMRKEAADNALALDGTSFMSRIIKVVKKSSAQQGAGPMTMCTHTSQGSPFTVPRFAQAPFPRVFPGAYRARPAVKVGARSMQWKRDAQKTSAESVISIPSITSAPSAGRGLTYISKESKKSDGNPGDA